MAELALASFVGLLTLPYWFLGFFVLAALVDIGFSSRDSFTGGTIAFILAFVGASIVGWWVEGPNPFTWVLDNPGDVALLFFCYALVGALWCIVRWWLFLGKVKRRAERDHAEKLKRDPDARKKRPRESYASNNASRLTGWIFHWPFSMLGVLIGDFLVRFAEAIYEALKGTLERMAKARFRDYEER